MLHTIFPHRYDVAFSMDDPKPDDIFLQICDHKMALYPEGNDYALPVFAQVAQKVIKDEVLHIGKLDQQNVYLYLPQKDTPLTPGTVLAPMQVLRQTAARGTAFAALNAFQIHQWVSENIFCGKCAAKLVFAPDERALFCPKCQKRLYPRINPAIITAILDPSNNKLLCAKGSHYQGGFYSLIAGYVEVGESFEQAVKREVMEEVGLEVSHITYFANQPWPFSSSQMVGYFCTLEGDPTPKINPSEIADAKWLLPQDIPSHPYPVSIASVMMEAYRKGEISAKVLTESPFAH